MTLSENIYADGTYISRNPSWGKEDAPFKAKHIFDILQRNQIVFSKVAEIGCGSGAVLASLRKFFPNPNLDWTGFDISNQAISLAKADADNDAIEFFEGSPFESSQDYDLLLAIDVFEHVPDYIGFLSKCRLKAKYKLYHIPLDIHVSSAFRDSFTNAREAVGHLHYFSERTALATLRDTEHKILDTMLTPGAIELCRVHPNLQTAVANLPRRLVGAMNKSLSARFFGGYSLLALTQ